MNRTLTKYLIVSLVYQGVFFLIDVISFGEFDLIVVIFSSDKTRWQTSLSRLKKHLDLILGQMLMEAVENC